MTWSQFFFNMIPVFLGNVTGGAAFVGASYLYAYRHLLKKIIVFSKRKSAALWREKVF